MLATVIVIRQTDRTRKKVISRTGPRNTAKANRTEAKNDTINLVF